MLLLMFGLGAAVGAFAGAAFVQRHLHTLRRSLADEMRHALVDEFSQRFRHIENQLDYLESAIKIHQLSVYDAGVPAPRVPQSTAG
jgi:fucose permease